MNGRCGLSGCVGWEMNSTLEASWDASRVRTANRIDRFLLTSAAFLPWAFHFRSGVQRIGTPAHLSTLTPGSMLHLTLPELLPARVPTPTALPPPKGLGSNHWLLR